MDTPDELEEGIPDVASMAREIPFLSNMKNNSHLVVMGLLALGAASFSSRSANATPSTLGAFPSTDIYGKGNVHYDADTYQSTDLRNGVVTTTGLTYGLGKDTSDLFGRTEVGIDYNVGATGPLQFSKRVFGNFKTQLYNNDDSQTRLVAGGWLLGDSQTNPNYAYLLGSKNVPKIGRFSAGYAYALSTGLFQVSNTPISGSPTRTRGRGSVHLGFDRYITPDLGLTLDYYSGKGPFGGGQATLYYYFNGGKSDFGLGYFRLNDRTAAVPNQFYICLDYNFDFKKSSPTTTAAPAALPETDTKAPAVN